MKLRRTIFGALAGLALLATAVPQEADAQIWTQYNITVVPRYYQPQAGRGIRIPRSSFTDIFSPSIVDPDNGVAGPIPIGFPVEYNGQTYTQVYVSVNGWVSFQKPITGGAGFFGDDPRALFNNSRPNLTLAPYYGDHYLRDPSFDGADPGGRAFTPSNVRYVNKPGATRDTFIVEWENLNINYFFDPLDPTNPFAPNPQPQATSIGSFQVYIIEADDACATEEPTIEFHYGPVGSNGTVKTQGASVGIEDEPAVPNGQTTFINAVAFRETGGNLDSSHFSRRLTTNYPPAGFPGQIFQFLPNCVSRISGWGDGDADLTQLNLSVPLSIREDQRRFVTFLDVIRILRHQATRSIEFDSATGRHGYHGDVNHDGRFYYSTRKLDNSADSTNGFGAIIRYRRNFPTKSTNEQLPFPNDNSFNGFFFDADQQDAALIMLYLAAKLPVLPWLPDTLPPFTGKRSLKTVANDIELGSSLILAGRRVEIPVTFNGSLNGGLGVRFEAGEGTHIVEIRTMPRTDDAWVEAIASDNSVALAAAGQFTGDEVIATIVVEADADGMITFENIKVGDREIGLRKMDINAPVTGEATLSLLQNFPNPFSIDSKTTISYTVPSEGSVSLRVFDVAGKEVKNLVGTTLGAGTHEIEWDGRDDNGNRVAAGIYFYRLETAGQTRSMSLQVR